MLLDLSTLYLIATLVAGMLGLMLLFFGRQEKIAALTWWGTAYLLGAASIAIWMLSGPYLGEHVALAASAAGFVACGMVWNAARIFHGRGPSWGGLLLGPAIWLAIVSGAIDVPLEMRASIGAAIVAVYVSLTAAELWSERRKALQRRWPAVVVPVLHGFVLLLPALLGDVFATDARPFAQSGWAVAFAVELVLYAVGTVFLIFLLVSERTVSAHKAAASVDPLTGLFNRRGFHEATSRMIAREAAGNRAVTVMIFDIDHFKSINDRFGHPAGDEVLKLFAGCISRSLRMTDLSGRIGGEEFAAVLPCTMDEALHAAERVRETFAGSGVRVDETPVDTTVSIGVAGGPAGVEIEVLLAAADTALYQAKRSGRNRVVAVQEEPLSLEGERLLAAGQPAQRKAAVVSSAIIVGGQAV